MTKDEETYLFLSQSIEILNQSLDILYDLKKTKTTPRIFSAAFRYALVEYGKPFGQTNGLIKNIDSNKTTRIKYNMKRFVLPKNMELHKRIIDSRNQFHAHGDMSILDANVYVDDGVDGRMVTVSQNRVDACAEFQNVDLLIDMIHSTLDNMDKELLVLEKALPKS